MQVNKALILHLQQKFQLSPQEIADELRYPLSEVKAALNIPSGTPAQTNAGDVVSPDLVQQTELSRVLAQSPKYAAVEDRLLLRIDEMLQEDELNPAQLRQLVASLKELRQLTPAPQMMPQQQPTAADSNITIQFLNADQLLNVSTTAQQ